MKRIVVCLMLGIFLATSYAVPAQAMAGFTDLSSDHWAHTNIFDLVDRDILNGYPDGSFKPEGTITVEEFIKTAVTSLGFTDVEIDEEDWSKPYIDKAIETGLVTEGDFSNYKKNINRAEMARIIARCMEYNKEVFEGGDEYIKTISDYNTIGSKFNDCVLKAYSKGIITGYPDGDFKADRNATRAEACTMIYRLIHEEEREPVEIPEERISVDDVVLKTFVYAEDEGDISYFYVRVVNCNDFPRDEFRAKITCTNLPEYNSYDAYAYGNPVTVVRDAWQKGANASFYINRVKVGSEGKVPIIVEPGIKFEFICTIEDLVTGESRDYPISLVTK